MNTPTIPTPRTPRTMIRLAALLALAATSATQAAIRHGMIGSQESLGAFRIAGGAEAATIVVAAEDHAGVARAARDLAADIGRVTGTASTVADATADVATPILVGTLGKSPLIDRLVAENRIDVAGIRGRWESYVIQIVDDPMPGVRRAMAIVGSDKRGTIYGIYDVSENIGVSPWHWWADVPVKKRAALWLNEARVEQGSPAVKYRGIFINDEAPAMSGWTRQQFGGFNSKMYTRVFELLLRLRANYLWPAMWGNAFNEDDPANARLADEYGIVMGTSHQEPMLRAQREFDKRFKPPQWNYATHPELMESFWRDGVRRNRDYESLITIGMRGRDDTEMLKGATIEQSVALTEKIVARQRQILADEVHPDATKVPQMWCLYKEVQEYYEHGLRVPDDVTLLWADDNWGNIRRVPTAEERGRSGGAGIYYHFDYVGGPRSYKWINTNPLPKIQEQMNLAYQHGADRIWIVNVGDLKPMELPIDFFLTMAWDPNAMTSDKVADYTRAWAAREFGEAHAAEIADVVARYAKFNGWRKPELLNPATFSLIHYGEADRVEAGWDDLVRRAEAIDAKLSPEQRDAFFQLVLYPTKASATVAKLYLAAARNALFAGQGRASANEQAERVRALFAQDQALTDAYHKLAGGKWNRMMAQSRIGYTGWQEPKTNVMPALKTAEPADGAALGVAVEGSADAWPRGKQPAALPAFDTLGRQRRWIDVFRRGTQSFDFTASADQPWVTLDRTSGNAERDQRVWITIDWSKVPAGTNDATITLTRDAGDSVAVRVRVVHAPDAIASADGSFGSLTEAFAIPADAASKNVPAGDVQWCRVPDYGRVAAAMTVYPVTAASAQPPARSPCLEYPVYLPAAGDVTVHAQLGPTLPYAAGRGLRLALSIDDGEPQILDAAMKAGSGQTWSQAVSDSVRTLSFKLSVAAPGRHTLKVWMVDPGVVLQQLVVDVDQAGRRSFFGPPARTVFGSATAIP